MVLTIANMKGGVSKTTLTQNLGFGLVRAGYSVLLIDLDGQYNLTQTFLEYEQEQTVYDLLEAESKNQLTPQASDLIYRFDNSPHLLPGGSKMAYVDLDLSGATRREGLLERRLRTTLPRYDFVLIDTPPSFGLAIQNALTISDYILIPVLAEYLPMHGVKQFIGRIDTFFAGIEDRPQIGGIILNQYDPRKLLSKGLAENIKKHLGDIVLNTAIRQNIAISEAQAAREDVFTYDPDSNGAKDYQALLCCHYYCYV